jgi:flagellar basal-body rod modification protein FlgD
MLTSLANTGAANAASATTAKSSQTDASASQDRFLKLLVAQLNNQDPMNPMDNAQMTSQMAQINTVSGIQQLNETIKSMSTQFTSMQVMQGASMIGRDVMTEGNTLAINAGVAKGAVDLSGAADRVTVQVKSPGGQVLDTLNLGSLPAGRTNFTWDASKYTGTGTPTFKITATQGTTAVTATALTRNTVESVSSDTAGMTVSLKGGATVKYDAIKAIL